jgi:hypothetical protein
VGRVLFHWYTNPNKNIDERKHFCTIKLIENFVADFRGVPAWRKKKRRKVPPDALSGPGTRDIKELIKSSFPSTKTPR